MSQLSRGSGTFFFLAICSLAIMAGPMFEQELKDL